MVAPCVSRLERFGSLSKKQVEGSQRETVIQVTHRLALSPAAAVELMKGLNTTMTTLKANVQRKI